MTIYYRITKPFSIDPFTTFDKGDLFSVKDDYAIGKRFSLLKDILDLAVINKNAVRMIYHGSYK